MDSISNIAPQLHLLMIVVAFSFCYSICYFGIKSRNIDRYSKKLGYMIIFFWIFYNIYYFLPHNFQWSVSLPLHVCDILGVVAIIAIFTCNRFARAFLYFAGIALAAQAFITPTGNQSPYTLRFWLFWGLHIGILSCAIFDIIVRKYRPNKMDYFASITVNIFYLIIIFPLDAYMGWNYGYIGNSKPDVPTVLDFLGKWPLRVVWMFLVVCFLQLIMLLPFQYIILRNKKIRS